MVSSVLHIYVDLVPCTQFHITTDLDNICLYSIPFTFFSTGYRLHNNIKLINELYNDI